MYNHWFHKSVSPQILFPVSLYDWKTLFQKEKRLREDFSVFQRESIDHVRVRKGPEMSVDELEMVLKIADYSSYQKYLNDMQQAYLADEAQAHVMPQGSRSPDSTAGNTNPFNGFTVNPTIFDSMSSTASVQSVSDLPEDRVRNDLDTDPRSSQSTQTDRESPLLVLPSPSPVPSGSLSQLVEQSSSSLEMTQSQDILQELATLPQTAASLAQPVLENESHRQATADFSMLSEIVDEFVNTARRS